MSKYKYEKEFIFSDKRPQDVKLFLKDATNIDLSAIRDQKHNTVIHQYAYNGEIQTLELYIDFMRKQWGCGKQFRREEVQQRVKNWINHVNKDGFSPIHYAVYKGHLQMVEFLEKLNADVNKRAKSGLNVLHLAAQNDKVNILIHFSQRMSLDTVDQKGSTPLHWAAFLGSEKVVEYILAVLLKDQRGKHLTARAQKLLNFQDHQGKTPLHLATENGNTKIVRKLLIAGADRHIKANSGLEAIDIAAQNEFPNIAKLLNDQYKCMDYVKFFMNVKMKYEPKKRSLQFPILFIMLSIIIAVPISLGVKFDEDNSYLFYIQQVMFALVFALQLSLIVDFDTRTDGQQYQDILRLSPSQIQEQEPRYEGDEKIGDLTSSSSRSASSKHKQKERQKASNSYLQVPQKRNQNERYEHVQTILSSNANSSRKSSSSKPLSLPYRQNFDNVCFYCIHVKPRRSHHCDICKKCVQQYDHHCPWINNCVGRSNLCRFVLFLIGLVLVVTWTQFVVIQLLLVQINVSLQCGYRCLAECIKAEEKSLIQFLSLSIHQVLQSIQDSTDFEDEGFHEKSFMPLLFSFDSWVLDLPQFVAYIFVGLVSLLYLFFIFPLVVLLCVQLYNLCLNKTTYERFSRANQSVLSKNRSDFISSREDVSFFGRGSNSLLTKRTNSRRKISEQGIKCSNCAKMCCVEG